MSNDRLPTTLRHITIVGGGFSGVCAAIQLVRASPVALSITLIESRPRIGPGLAYSTTDPDHRLNGSSWAHSLIPEDAGHFTRWCEVQGIFAHDAQALWPDGSNFVRRADYGRYLEDTLHAHALWPATGSTISCVCAQAIAASQQDHTITVHTADGRAWPCELLILATGNALPKLQAPLHATLAQHPSVLENPLDTTRLQDIPTNARVLLVGSGLTSLDVLSTLQRQQHAGQIVVISRRGLRPRPQPHHTEPVVAATGRQNLERIFKPAPAFLTPPATPATVRHWVRALRTQIRSAQTQGGQWYGAFDELRDAVWQLWPQLPSSEKRRFLKKLRTWYDVHRFRAPPPNDAIVNAAQTAGRIEYRTSKLLSATALTEQGRLKITLQNAKGHPYEETFDILVNCTGLDVGARINTNPLLHALVAQGWLQRDDCGIGLAVDAQCRAIGGDGITRPSLRLIGPPTAGTFGDPLGALFIAMQIRRILPDVLASLGIRTTA